MVDSFPEHILHCVSKSGYGEVSEYSFPTGHGDSYQCSGNWGRRIDKQVQASLGYKVSSRLDYLQKKKEYF